MQMLVDAFRGHGTFTYLAKETLRKFGNSADRLREAFHNAGMTHAWIRLHDHAMVEEPEAPTRTLIKHLTDARVALAGWGFDAGRDPVADARRVADMLKKYGLTHYVADIEQDEHQSEWTPDAVATFLTELRVKLPAGAQILVSSYPYIIRKHPELMRAAAPLADGFAPQIYWNDYPAPYMLQPGALPPHPSRPYNVARDAHDPVAYADLCLDWWRETVGAKPLVLTGQAYWGEGGFTRAKAETKLAAFLACFTAGDASPE